MSYHCHVPILTNGKVNQYSHIVNVQTVATLPFRQGAVTCRKVTNLQQTLWRSNTIQYQKRFIVFLTQATVRFTNLGFLKSVPHGNFCYKGWWSLPCIACFQQNWILCGWQKVWKTQHDGSFDQKNIFSWGHCGILSTIIRRFVFNLGLLYHPTIALQLCRVSRFLLKYIYISVFVYFPTFVFSASSHCMLQSLSSL